MNVRRQKLLDELRNVVKYINEQYPNQEFEKDTLEKMLTEWAGKDRRTVRKYLDVMYEYFLTLTPPENEPEPKKGEKSTKREKRTGTKSEVAKNVYLDGKDKGQSRKQIIERFISEARLTRNGSSTYYQLLKRKHEEGTL